MIIHIQAKLDYEWVVHHKIESDKDVEIQAYIHGLLTIVRPHIEIDDDQFYVSFSLPRAGLVKLKECTDD